MIEVESMAVEMPRVEGHPNRTEFRGVLTVVDAVSQRAPSGSKGHRVVLTRAAAEAALPSLLGMALDYAPSFDRHDVRRKVGVITSAEIVGRNLEVGGYLYAKDFPEIVQEVEKQASGVRPRTSDAGPRAASAGTRHLSEGERLRAALGAAVEKIRRLTTRVENSDKYTDKDREICAHAGGALGMSYEVTDVRLADTRSKVWILTKVTFTGAAILRRNKAAYEETWIELSG